MEDIINHTLQEAKTNEQQSDDNYQNIIVRYVRIVCRNNWYF